MPEKETLRRARADKRAGKSPTTQAGEFVREEIHHVREGKHGARSAKQAIAIGLSKARRSGVDLPAPPASASESTKRSAKSARRRAGGRKRSTKRARASMRRLKRESRSTTSRQALSRQAKQRRDAVPAPRGARQREKRRARESGRGVNAPAPAD